MQNYLQFWNLRIGFIGRNLTLPNITLIIDDFNLRITGWGHFSALPHIISISGDFKLENLRESVQAQLIEPFMKPSSLKSLFIFFGKHYLYDSYKPVGESYDSAARGKVRRRYRWETTRAEIINDSRQLRG
jgi:hypothetical protein